MYKVEFPRSYIDLAREVQYHPQLATLINPAADFHINLGSIAAYCNVILDGEYTSEDVEKICERLTEILHRSRIELIN